MILKTTYIDSQVQNNSGLYNKLTCNEVLES